MSPIASPLYTEVTDFGNRDICYYDSRNRERTDAVVDDWLIDGLVPIGAMVIYSDPGAGKSMIVGQIVHHLAYGRPLGPWGTDCPGENVVRVFDLEGWWGLNQERGYNITPFGKLKQDGVGEDHRTDNFIVYSHSVIPAARAANYEVFTERKDRNLTYLADLLVEAETAGSPIRMVVIDTLTKFVGPKPQNAAGNSYEYEAAVIDRLNRLGLDHKCAIVIVTHTNKAGEISGSQGIGGSAMVMCKLNLNPRTEEDIEQGVPATGVLKSVKVRMASDFCYSIEQDPDTGVWEFVDKPPSVAEANGHARLVLTALAKGPKTKSELLAETKLGKSLPTTLTRMRKQGSIFPKYGQWHAAQLQTRSLPGQADGVCKVCNGPMTVIEEGQETHPGCDLAEGRMFVPGDPGLPDVEVEADGEFSEKEMLNGFRALEDSISKSRMYPVMRIGSGAREFEPWNLVTERMSGEHRWVRNLPEPDADTAVIVLDRNGSYPSAMGSVPVAANLLTHAGPLEGLPEKTAGIFKIVRPVWGEDTIGSPLGRIEDEDSDELWVSTPHLILLDRLAEQGRLKCKPVILDSWTGRGTTGLFTDFSKRVQEARLEALEAGDSERYAEVKRSSSVAIRCLWPKGAKSPFWRPDWSVSVRAEAAVRHWVRADQARMMGAVLLKIGTVDEVAMVRPDSGEVPEPYTLGNKYGQVKIKEQVAYSEWVERRGNRAR